MSRAYEYAARPRRRIPWWSWPIVLLWRLVTALVKLTGILLALLIGLVCMMVGVALCMTFFGAVFGIPIFIVGLFFTLRALY